MKTLHRAQIYLAIWRRCHRHCDGDGAHVVIGVLGDVFSGTTGSVRASSVLQCRTTAKRSSSWSTRSNIDCRRAVLPVAERTTRTERRSTSAARAAATASTDPQGQGRGRVQGQIRCKVMRAAAASDDDLPQRSDIRFQLRNLFYPQTGNGVMGIIYFPMVLFANSHLVISGM